MIDLHVSSVMPTGTKSGLQVNWSNVDVTSGGPGCVGPEPGKYRGPERSNWKGWFGDGRFGGGMNGGMG